MSESKKNIGPTGAGGMERRTATGRVEQRAAGTPEGFDFEGVASSVGQEYVMFENSAEVWVEEIAPGAFDGVLEDDVRILVNHKDSAILGRTKSGTAKIWADGTGLRYAWKNDEEMSHGKDVAVSIRRGDIDQSSFGFRTAWENNKWEEYPMPDGRRKYKRTILKFDELYDCSPVTFPANPNTAVGARDYEAALAEYKQQRSNQCPPVEDADVLDIYFKRLALNEKLATT